MSFEQNQWFSKIGKIMYRYRFIVCFFWTILLIVTLFFAQKTPSLLKENGFDPTGSESDQALEVIKNKFEAPASTVEVVYSSLHNENLYTPEKTKEIMQAHEKAKNLPYIQSVEMDPLPPLEDKKDVRLVYLHSKKDMTEMITHMNEIKQSLNPLPSVKRYVTGSSAVYADMQEASKRDIIKSEMIGLPVALVVLILVFGTLFGMLLPIIVGLVSVSFALGSLYFIALNSENMSNFLPNIITMLGLALGIDYALFMVSRFREELKQCKHVEQAVMNTAQKAGSAVFFSGLAVLIGLVFMYIIDLAIFQSISIGGVLVVFGAVLIANTLLLALFGILGERINKFRIVKIREDKDGTFWRTLAYKIMRYPIIFASLCTVLLLLMTSPLSRLQLGLPEAEVLPPKYESRFGSDLIKRSFDTKRQHALIALLTLSAHDTSKQINQFVAKVESMDGVKKVYPPPVIIDRQAVVTILSDNPAKLVVPLRSLKNEQTNVQITGSPAYKHDVVERIHKKLPFVILGILGVTYVILLFAFQSVILPLKAVLMNILSLGSSIGIVIWVFQDGYFADWLKITSTGEVFAVLPVIIFCIVFGISMDYEVFLISRIKEEYERTSDNELSTCVGLEKTAGIITSAAFILIVIVGAFIFTDIEIMKAIGLGLASAVFIDVSLVRIFLVPAFMKLLGQANWWAPKWIKKV